MKPQLLPLGAIDLGTQTLFRIWAPLADKVTIRFENYIESIDLEAKPDGYHERTVQHIKPGTNYWVLLDDAHALPDPASRAMPHGVHGPSAIASTAFPWRDGDWKGLALRDMIIYELHVGTFTKQGDFAALIEKIPYIKDLGVNTIELMPLHETPGKYNWGYDSVGLFSVNRHYGGVVGLKRFVDACHAENIAVILDVVYNHLGPEGNYLPRFGPYFTDKLRTPWGAAVNVDEAYADFVRHFFLENMRYWIEECHLDGLRLDAVGEITRHAPLPFTKEMGIFTRELEKRLGRTLVSICETCVMAPDMVRSLEKHGEGHDACWVDDFAHAVNAYYTGERLGYYQDYGDLESLAYALRKGQWFDDRYCQYRHRHWGRDREDSHAAQVVFYSQSHDLIGNRPQGDRIGQHIKKKQMRQIQTMVLLAPFTPMLFMGEEYLESAPFPFFNDLSGKQNKNGVRRGRHRQLRAFGWKEKQLDPCDKKTFQAARLQWDLLEKDDHHSHFSHTQNLIALRKKLLANGLMEEANWHVEQHETEPVLVFGYQKGELACWVIANCGDKDYEEIELPMGQKEQKLKNWKTKIIEVGM